MRHCPSLVVGLSAHSDERIDVRSPYSGQAIGTVEQADAGQVEAALQAAHHLFRDRDRWLSVAQRCQILERTAQIMGDRFDALVEVAASGGGEPLLDSRVEVTRAIDGVKLCIEHIRTQAGEVVPMSEPPPSTRMAFTQKEPIGVVVAVSAFNHPLNLIVHQVGAAVAAGCPVIVKPAEDTPLSCWNFVEILHDAGLPKAWAQALLTTDHAHSTALVADPRVAFFSFIGSARVGWMLRSKLASGTRCALEHGGAAPVIIDRSAALDKVVPALLKGGYYHAGQVCVSVQRVFVPKALLAETTRLLAEGAKKLVVGDPLSEDTEVGPLIRPGEVARVHDWVEEAVRGGAELACGGTSLANNCYAPTLLVDPPQDARVSCNEVFGPVVCLFGYDGLGESIGRANGLDVAFQAAAFAQDIDRAFHIARRLDASAVMINDHTAFRQDGMPFAGLRQSGHGVGWIGHSIDDMQVDKMFVIKARGETG